MPFNARLGAVDGYLWGSSDHESHIVTENGEKFLVNWEKGQKTGFFLDQRENRELVKRYAKGRTVLNTFCYTADSRSTPWRAAPERYARWTPPNAP